MEMGKSRMQEAQFRKSSIALTCIS